MADKAIDCDMDTCLEVHNNKNKKDRQRMSKNDDDGKKIEKLDIMASSSSSVDQSLIQKY